MKWKLCSEPLSLGSYGGRIPHTAIAEDGIVFAAAVPEGQKARVLLYQKRRKEKVCEIPFPEEPFSGDVYAMKVSGIPADEIEYAYLLGDRVATDPYAQILSGSEAYGEERKEPARAQFAAGDFDWADDRKPLKIPYRDSIFYELNVRSFTKGRRSGVKAKGTFRGLQEKASYLKNLGITAVVLEPVYEFDETLLRQKTCLVLPEMQLSESFRELKADRNLKKNVSARGSRSSGHECSRDKIQRLMDEKVNLWGFGPGYLLAPKRAYCAGKDPYTEFCSMVKTFHMEGIEVILEMDFSKVTSIALMETALFWWKHIYHIDGFVLFGRQSDINAVCKSPALADSKLISDYFSPEEMYPQGRAGNFRNLAECNYGFREDARRLLKGDENSLRAYVDRNRYNPKDTAVINSITGHDGFTMMDLVSYNESHNEENGDHVGDRPQFSWNCGQEGPSRRKEVMRLRMRQIKNAFAMTFFSQGTPLFFAGDELGNTQKGNSNAWSLDNETTWNDWSSSAQSREIQEFVKKLIAFRKSHPLLHKENELSTGGRGNFYPEFSCHGASAWFATYDSSDRSVGMMYCDYGQDDRVEEKADKDKGAAPGSYLYIAYNFHWEKKELALPTLPRGREWKLVLSTSDEPAEVNKTVSVPGRSVLVLADHRSEP